MNRSQLEHVIRATAAVCGENDLVVVGSQAILANCNDPPPELLVSMEADLYPAKDPEKAALIDGSIGEQSIFHETFGYYGHGVGPETARLPADWRNRAVPLSNENTGGAVAWCPAPADLAVSKLLAGRGKDIEFVRTMLRVELVRFAAIEGLADELDEPDARRLREAVQHLRQEQG